ncbi:carbohydrate porin, partial [Nostoc sp. 'Peltigera malacea cyanobiont' DB3992]
VSDNISVTPGVIWLTSPGQNSDNDDAIIGTLRTTFTF